MSQSGSLFVYGPRDYGGIETVINLLCTNITQCCTHWRDIYLFILGRRGSKHRCLGSFLCACHKLERTVRVYTFQELRLRLIWHDSMIGVRPLSRTALRRGEVTTVGSISTTQRAIAATGQIFALVTIRSPIDDRIRLVAQFLLSLGCMWYCFLSQYDV
jgi:hypothetical protein